jgi:hypothetical protein
MLLQQIGFAKEKNSALFISILLSKFLTDL